MATCATCVVSQQELRSCQPTFLNARWACGADVSNRIHHQTHWKKALLRIKLIMPRSTRGSLTRAYDLAASMAASGELTYATHARASHVLLSRPDLSRKLLEDLRWTLKQAHEPGSNCCCFATLAVRMHDPPTSLTRSFA